MRSASEPSSDHPRTSSHEAYSKVAQAIRALGQNPSANTDWRTVARSLDWTPQHLQRVFADWAGITPQQFLQVVRMNAARQALDRESVLEASHSAGLSGPGRLHDLVVRLEAATPGQWKSGGQGLQVVYGFGDTPFGRALLAWTAHGITFLQFTSELEPTVTEDQLLERLQTQWPAAEHVHDPSEAEHRLTDLFGPNRLGAPLSLWVRGTNFQIQVWRALLALAPGQTTSYGDLAQSLGHRQSARAVAGAVAANSIALLIPCHRVLRANGALSGYRWGWERKRALLAWESLAQSPNAMDGGATATDGGAPRGTRVPKTAGS